jgi:hypothetical protein
MLITNLFNFSSFKSDHFNSSYIMNINSGIFKAITVKQASVIGKYIW